MSKNILILASSPRKSGNSDILCDRFLQGAQEAGHTVEKIRVAESHIGFCLGCDHCKRHEGVCVQHDDMAVILKKMIEADVIVMATPVYFYTMNAQMKTLIDRTYARYTEVRGKEFYVILTAADSSLDMMTRTVESFRGFFVCLDDAVEKGVLYGVGAWAKGDVAKIPAMDLAYEFGRSA